MKDLSDFERTLESLPLALFRLDSVGIITYVNRAALRISKQSRLEGYSLQSLIGPVAAPRLLAQAKDPTTTEPFICSLNLPNGRARSVLAYSSVFHNLGEEPEGVIVLLAETAPNRSSRMTRLLIDHLPNQIFWKDPDGIYMGCNAAFAEIAGLESPSDVVGKTDFDLALPRAVAERYRRSDRKILESGEPVWDMLDEFTTEEGETGYLLTSKVPIRDSDDTVTGVLGLCMDVSERAKSERALARSEERLRMITEKAGVAVWEYDVAQNRMWRTRRHDELYGLQGVKNWTAETFFSTLHPDDHDYVTSLVEASFAPDGPEQYSLDFRVVWPDQSVHWLSISAEVTERDESGHGAKVCGCVVDVSERKSVEEALLRREAILKEAQAIANFGNWSYDLSTREVEWSEEIDRIAGVLEEEPFDPEVILSRVHPDDRHKYQEAIRELHTQGEARCTFRLVQPSGEVRWVSAQGKTDFKGAGRPFRMVGTILDITEQKQKDEEKSKLEEQFHQAQKMEAIGRLAGGVAHDFNNLLTVINSYAELVIAGLGPEHTHNPDLQEILKAGSQAASLTRQLLTFSRKQPMEVQLLDLNEIVRRVERMLSRLIGEDIQITIDLGSKIEMVEADPAQIEQILLNLSINARDAMPSGGSLCIKTKQATPEEASAMGSEMTPGNYVILEISDTGTGIEADILEQIFDPFFTTKEHDRGTGLGLSTVHGIVEQTGGYIFVKSEVGRGTCFQIFLPTTSRKKKPSAQWESSINPTANETILLVEDDRAVRKLIGRSLSAVGYRVVSAEDGERGLKQFEASSSVALVLTDVVMPGMSGKEMADLITLQDPTVKVLFMSGYAENVIAHNGVLDDGVQFISKPFSLANLQAKVQSVLRSENRPTPVQSP